MPKILVVGGTGMLGRPVTLQLMNDGFDIRLFTTNTDRAKKIFGDKVDYALGDIGDRESLKTAMAGCDFVYINLKGGPTKEDYIRIESDGAKNIYAATGEAGIKKIVQISGAHVYEKNSAYPFIGCKVEAEKALVASGLTYIILKPSWFIESLPLFLQKDKAVFIGSGKSSFYFLAASDFARIASDCFKTDRADNKMLTIFGPEPMPIPEAMRRFLSICYPDAKIDRLPIWLAKLSAILTFNKKLKMAVDMMGFFDRHDDSEVKVGPEEAKRIFGPCHTTIEQWSEVYKKVVAG